MTTDIEAHLRQALSEAADEVSAPVGFRRSVEEKVRRRDRLHRRVYAGGAAAICLAALLIAGGLVQGGRDDRDEVSTVAPDPAPPVSVDDRWATLVDPELGWEIDYPEAWRADQYSGQCRIRQGGTIVTNLNRPVPFEDVGGNACTTARDLVDVPSNFVGVEIARFSGGPTAGLSPSQDADRLFAIFPLALRDAVVAPGVSPPTAMLDVMVADGLRYQVTVWTGQGASPADRERLGRVVSSIRRQGGPPPTAFTPGPVLTPRTVQPPSGPPPTPPATTSVVMHSQWAFRGLSGDGRILTIGVPGGGCTGFEGVDVAEESGSVTVSAFVRVVNGVACAANLDIHVEAVVLKEALGNRRLVGACVPGTASPEERLCDAASRKTS